MTKNIIIATAALFLIASPVYASQSPKNNEDRNGDNRGQVISSEHREDEKEKKEIPVTQESVVVTVDVSPTLPLIISPTSTSTPRVDDQDEKEKGSKKVEGEGDCDSGAEWKNHGEYVSCVARLHLDGDEVSEAARSEIGKKADDHDNDGDDDISPTITPSVSPTITPPLTSPMAELHFSLTSWEDLKKFFTQLFRSFRFNRGHNG